MGPPADDDQAISELERERAAGAVALVLAWPSFWWMEYYLGLVRHLEERYQCFLRNDTLVVYDLTEPAAVTSPG